MLQFANHRIFFSFHRSSGGVGSAVSFFSMVKQQMHYDALALKWLSKNQEINKVPKKVFDVLWEEAFQLTMPPAGSRRRGSTTNKELSPAPKDNSTVRNQFATPPPSFSALQRSNNTIIDEPAAAEEAAGACV